MMNPAVAWILALMVQAAPPPRLAAAYQLPGHEETEAEKVARYESFASDLYEVVYDPSVKPLFGGKQARALTAATILGVAYHESGFAHDVDKGPCYRGKNGRDIRCDGGMSACSMQIKLGAGTTLRSAHGVEGLTQEDLFGDRKLCFRVGLYMLRRSVTSCTKRGPNERLNAYASGRCDQGADRSKEILNIVRKFLANKEAVPADARVPLVLAPPPVPGPLSLLEHAQ
jgi:hypothetical protein